MKTHTDQLRSLALSIAGIAVILFSIAGFTRMTGWSPVSTGAAGGILASNQADPALAREARAGPRCAECGMIVSIREIEPHGGNSGSGPAGAAAAGKRGEPGANSGRSLEIVVRMADGSSRVINDPRPARWRTGERLIVIGGLSPPGE